MFTKKILALTIVIPVVILCSFNFNDGKDDIDKLRKKEITKEEIYQHIKYLSSDELEGRFPGTKGDSLSISYVAGEFKKYKLKPYGEKGYFQPFEMVTQMKLSDVNEFQINSNGSVSQYEVEKDFTPLGFSSSGIIEGELVFAGYGITAPEQIYDDYKDNAGNDIDINGKILVMMRYSPGGSDAHNNPFEKYEPSRFKSIKAKERNAAGIIIVSGPNSGDDQLMNLAYDKAMQDAGIPVINCRREIIENIFKSKNLDLSKIQKKIDSSKTPNSFPVEDVTVKMKVNISPVKVVTANVIGMLEGNDPVLKNEAVVIGAHRDHLGYGEYGSLYRGNDKQIHNGADDNASGTAGLLELAQKFSSNKKNLKRSIMFISFGAEEAGLLGSAYFTKSKIFEKLNIDAMINMDMIGRMSQNKLIIYGTGTSSIWNSLLDSLNSPYGFVITKTPDGFGPSDHSSFYAKNIPVLHFFSGTHADYHSPSDDYQKINAGGEAKIVKMIYDIAMFLDLKNVKPDFMKVASTDTTKRSMGSIKVYVGTIPDYSATVEGMKLAGVKEGSPAEKGGLKAEDIIIKFGDKDVKNIYDYMYAMGEYKPGDEAEIMVLRNNEKVTLKVVLGSR